MRLTETSTRQAPEPASTAPAPGPGRGARQGGRRILAALALFGACAGAVAYFAWAQPEKVRDAWSSLKTSLTAPHLPRPGPTEPAARGPWDGFVTLSERARTSMGVVTTTAKPQTEPIRLELLGTTEYDSDNLTKVRPLFKGRVDKVYTTVGKTVKKGEPLIDLYSTVLAEAKSTFEITRIQWVYDKNLVTARQPLVKKGISEQLFLETQNNEMKSKREHELARDRLLVFGLSEDEIDRVKDQAGSQKARMTLRSPADGIVITRDVVVGNLYDEDDTLLVIAPLDHLWVWGNVFESDLDLVNLGQSWEIQFPFLTATLQGKVEYISNRVDPGTHAVRVRTSIPNAQGHLKSDMLVRGMLEIPPIPGQTVIPRTALVVAHGRFCIFVKLDGSAEKSVEKFERRAVEVAQEKDDHVVVESGLREGEVVVSVGSLLLNQLYEDMKTAQTGAPPDDGRGID
jgi:membrane fusion protein, heavy metal efflux system